MARPIGPPVFGRETDMRKIEDQMRILPLARKPSKGDDGAAPLRIFPLCFVYPVCLSP